MYMLDSEPMPNFPNPYTELIPNLIESHERVRDILLFFEILSLCSVDLPSIFKSFPQSDKLAKDVRKNDLLFAFTINLYS